MQTADVSGVKKNSSYMFLYLYYIYFFHAFAVDAKAFILVCYHSASHGGVPQVLFQFDSFHHSFQLSFINKQILQLSPQTTAQDGTRPARHRKRAEQHQFPVTRTWMAIGNCVCEIW